MTSTRRLWLALATTSTLWLAACATMTVHSFADVHLGTTRYHTYGWADDDSRQTGDPRLDNNPFFETTIRAGAERELAAQGFEQVTSGAADLSLHYHASITQKLDAAAADQKYGYCDGCRSPTLYDAGTILLDFVDTRTNTLVWRGWAEINMDRMVEDQRWLEQRIDEAVTRIVATIPKRLSL